MARRMKPNTVVHPALVVAFAMFTGCAPNETAPPSEAGGGEQRADREVLVDREVSLVAGRSQAIAFEVPSDAVSITVTVAGRPEEVYAIESWRQPGGELVVGGWVDAALQACLDCPNRVLSNFGAVAALAPNNPGVTLEPGEHVLEIVGFIDDIVPEPSEADVALQIMAKVAPTLPEAGRLDMNLHFTGAAGLDASAARTDVELQAALDELQAVYAEADITLGEVRYLDVDPAFQTLHDFYPPTDMMELLATVHPDASPDAVNVFFVSELGDGALGKATVPGPPYAGTPQSGVVVAFDESEPLSLVLAHELGHHLGLWHTQDPIGADLVSDQLSDTGDYDTNVMSSEQRGGVLTEQQRRVLLSHPFVRTTR